METIYFHDSIKVVHLDEMNSQLFINGELRFTYGPNETAWQDAEREAYDLTIERMYRK